MAITALAYSLAPLGIVFQSAFVRIPADATQIDAILIVHPDRNIDPEFSAQINLLESRDAGKTQKIFGSSGKNSGFAEWTFTPRIVGGSPGEVNPQITENWDLDWSADRDPPWGDGIATGKQILDPVNLWIGVSAIIYSGGDAGVNRAVVLVARNLAGESLVFDGASWVGGS
jgi:hypothetical protein